MTDPAKAPSRFGDAQKKESTMSYRLKLSVLTMLAGFAIAFPGCSDDDDSDDGGGDAGEGPSATGGKASTGGSTSKGGSTSSEGGADVGLGGEGTAGGATGDGGTPSEGGMSSEGGATAEAGSPGTGGSGMGGASGGTCEAAPCLEDLMANCVPEGECTLGVNIDVTDPDPMINIATCWDNGVKAGFTEYDEASGSATMEFQNANGTPCYVLETQLDGSGTTTGEFRTVGGEVVATMTVDNNTNSNTIVCMGGDTYVYEPGTCEDEAPQVADPSQCTMGTCTLE
jgi:hypothetical protein